MADVINIPVMVTIDAAAAKFGLSRHLVRSLVLEKKIKYVKSGKKYLVNEGSLISYLNEGDE